MFVVHQSGIRQVWFSGMVQLQARASEAETVCAQVCFIVLIHVHGNCGIYPKLKSLLRADA